MPAAIFRGHRKAAADLLRRLDRIRRRLPVADESECAFVEDQRCIDQLAVIREQPARAVAAATFLIGGKRDHDIAIGNVAVRLHLHHDRGKDRDLRLVVDDAAAIEIAVLLEKLERIEVG